MQNKIPTVVALYRKDFTITYAIQAVVIALVFSGGVFYADPAIAPVVLAVALPVALVGLVVFAVRYNTVISTLRDGVTVKGIVEGFDHHVTKEKDDWNRVKSKRYSYYVNVSYVVNGETYKKQIRMPNSGFVYNIHDKQEVELIYKESSPQKVLIKNVYFSRF